jgi:hypothetical protein
MKQIRFSLRTLLTLIVVLSLCLATISLYLPTRHNRLRWLFGGAAGCNTVLQAEKAFVSRVRPPVPGFDYEMPVSALRVDSGPIEIPKNSVAKLANTLLSVESYDWEWAKACGMFPDYKLTFVRGSKQLDVILDSGCEVLAVYRNDKFVGFEDFDRVHPIIIPLLENALERSSNSP